MSNAREYFRKKKKVRKNRLFKTIRAGGKKYVGKRNRTASIKAGHGQAARIKADRIKADRVKASPIKTGGKRSVIRRRGRRLGRAAVLCVLTIAIAAAAAGLAGHTYEAYEVQSNQVLNGSKEMEYLEFNGGILQYDSQGVTYINKENQREWNYSFQMQEPFSDTCGSMAAIGDIRGNRILLFDPSGKRGEIHTQLPIRRYRVSDRGLAAVILAKGEDSRLEIYDGLAGDLLSGHDIPEDSMGYPADLDISPDGTKLIVSYMRLAMGPEEAVSASHIAFYRLQKVGSETVSQLVSSKIIQEDIFPQVVFLDSSHAAALGSGGMLLFEGNEIPELLEQIDLPEEERAEAYFSNNHYVGMTVAGQKEKAPLLKIYSANGELQFTKKLEEGYDRIKLYTEQVLVCRSASLRIYEFDGRFRYSGNMPLPILEILPGSKKYEYVVVDSASIRQIRLH